MEEEQAPTSYEEAVQHFLDYGYSRQEAENAVHIAVRYGARIVLPPDPDEVEIREEDVQHFMNYGYSRHDAEHAASIVARSRREDEAAGEP